MMRIAARYVLLLLLLAQPTWAAEVFLHVFFEEAPLQNVEVSIDGNPAGVTDGRGALFTDVDSGEHRLALSFQGNQIAEVSITTSDESTEEFEIEVSYSRDGSDPRISVQSFTAEDSGGESGILSGTVSDRNGIPVAGATVASGDVSTVTDADGTFGIELPRGEQDVSITADGYSTANLYDLRIFSNVGVTTEVEMLTQRTVDLGVAAPQLEEIFVLGTFNPSIPPRARSVSLPLSPTPWISNSWHASGTVTWRQQSSVSSVSPLPTTSMRRYAAWMGAISRQP